MNSVEIIDENGIKVNALGIYYISNNNYYFIYTKQELDDQNHVILYITKVLREVTNTPNGQVPTGYIIGVKVDDENEYTTVKNDIVNIIEEKQSGKDPTVRYLDLSMLSNYKVKDYRVFKLDKNTYSSVFGQMLDEPGNNSDVTDYKAMYEEEVNKNSILQKSIDELTDKMNRLKEIIN